VKCEGIQGQSDSQGPRAQSEIDPSCTWYQGEQVSTARQSNGRFAPGASGNRSGRPRGAAGTARKILDETQQGDELVEWALTVWRDSARTHAERAAMHAWLADRALGKAMQTSELTLHNGDAGDEPEPDFTKLSIGELRLYLQLAEKCRTDEGDGHATRALDAKTESDSQASALNAADCTSESDRAAR
jgi:hypothetical protein